MYFKTTTVPEGLSLGHVCRFDADKLSDSLNSRLTHRNKQGLLYVCT